MPKNYTALKNNKLIVYSSVIDTSCDERLVKLELKKLKDFDCVISLSCGSGVQTIGDLIDVSVISALDSKYVGSIIRIGNFNEKCSLCGDCVLNDYAGICPVTRCSKHLLNGPCGGSYDGKCEEDERIDCAWKLIYKRMKKYGKTNQLLKIKNPKNWNK